MNERLLLVRPLRAHERVLLHQPPSLDSEGPKLVPFPENKLELEGILRRGRGSPKAAQPALNCEGTVKCWMDDKGFGFFACAEGEVFVHRNHLPSPEPLVEGQAVIFDIVEDTRNNKTRASNVRLVGQRVVASPPGSTPSRPPPPTRAVP